MSQLKSSVMKSVYDALNNRIFSGDDFIVEFPKTGRVLAKIKFIHNDSYYFHIAENPKSKGIAAAITAFTDTTLVPTTIERPGNYKNEEEHQFDSFDYCISRISEWCKNIKTDLQTKFPIYQDLDELKQQFDRHIQEHIQNPDDMISTVEIEKINEKFDSLYAEFVKLSEEHKITKELLGEVKRDFDIIKDSASQYPKGMWANLAKNRVIQVIKKISISPEGRKLMYEGAKRLLGLD